MAQHDYDIANQSGSAFRADLNNALAAIVSQNSGASAPSTTYAYQLWIDTSTTPATIKRRDAANSSWITIGFADGTFPSLVPASSTVPTNGLYLPAANTVALATNSTGRLFIDSSGRLGLGTSSVASLLHLASTGPVLTLQRSDSASPGCAIHFTNNTGGVNWQIGTNQAVGGSAFEINAGNQSNNRFVITSGGAVGIGTTGDPGGFNARLSIDNTADTYVTVNTTGSANVTGLHFRNSNSNGEARIVNNTGGALTFYGNASTERARIDSSGRLLVGTSSTSANVRAIIQSTSGDANGPGNFFLARGDSTPANGAGLGYLAFTDSGHASAAYVGAERDGGTWNTGTSRPTRLVFSVTRDGSASPTEALRIASNGQASFFGAASILAPRSAVSAGTSEYLLVGLHSATTNANGTDCIRIYTNGNVQNTNNSYAGISDIKLKENIVDASSQWNDLKALQVRNYNFKEETGQQTHTQIGLIAQEVELVSPGLVSESPDRDEDGNDLGTVTKSVNYSVLYMKAVKALQEAMERIEQLEAKVAALEAA